MSQKMQANLIECRGPRQSEMGPVMMESTFGFCSESRTKDVWDDSMRVVDVVQVLFVPVMALLTKCRTQAKPAVSGVTGAMVARHDPTSRVILVFCRDLGMQATCCGDDRHKVGVVHH